MNIITPAATQLAALSTKVAATADHSATLTALADEVATAIAPLNRHLDESELFGVQSVFETNDLPLAVEHAQAAVALLGTAAGQPSVANANAAITQRLDAAVALLTSPNAYAIDEAPAAPFADA